MQTTTNKTVEEEDGHDGDNAWAVKRTNVRCPRTCSLVLNDGGERRGEEVLTEGRGRAVPRPAQCL